MYHIPSVKVQLVRDGSIPSVQRPIIRTPADIYSIMQPSCDLLCEEHLYVIMLSTKNHVTAIQEVSIGSLNASIVHPREVFKAAFLSNAASIILVHNHPSGDATPSPEDVQLTTALIECGKLLSLPVLDHVIIGDRNYASFKEKSMM